MRVVVYQLRSDRNSKNTSKGHYTVVLVLAQAQAQIPLIPTGLPAQRSNRSDTIKYGVIGISQ